MLLPADQQAQPHVLCHTWREGLLAAETQEPVVVQLASAVVIPLLELHWIGWHHLLAACRGLGEVFATGCCPEFE